MEDMYWIVNVDRFEDEQEAYREAYWRLPKPGLGKFEMLTWEEFVSFYNKKGK